MGGSYVEGMEKAHYITPQEVQDEIAQRYGTFLPDNEALRHYCVVALPQAILRMQAEFSHNHLRVVHHVPDIIQRLVLTDMMPLQDRLVPNDWRMESDIRASRYGLRSVLKEAYKADGAPYANTRASESFAELTRFFSGCVHAHMGFDQLQFFEHPMLDGREHPPKVLSIDMAQLQPWMDASHTKDVEEFFRFLGVEHGVTVYPGPRDEKNGMDARVLLDDAKGIAHLKELGAHIAPSENVWQVSGNVFGAIHKPQRGGADDGLVELSYEDWAAKVKARKARKQLGEPTR